MTVPRPFVHSSPSQVKTFRRCASRWWAEKIAGIHTPSTPATRYGQSCHKKLEDYLVHGDEITGKEAVTLRPVLHLFPAPGTVPKRHSETPIRLETPHVPVIGYLDLVHPFEDLWEVTDLKTTSDLAYAPEEDELRRDAQCAIYGRALLQEVDDTAFFFRHVYAQTSAPAGRERRIKVSRQENDDRWGGVVETVGEQVKYSTATDMADTEGDLRACGDYGGCHFKNICPTWKKRGLNLFNKGLNLKVDFGFGTKSHTDASAASGGGTIKPKTEKDWAAKVPADVHEMLKGRPLLASVSGGKDSTVLAHWLQTYVKPAGGITLIHADTGWESALTDQYVREYLPKVIGEINIVKGLPTLSLEDEVAAFQFEAMIGKTGSAYIRWILKKKAFSGRVLKWCTSYLKVIPIQQFMWDNFQGNCVNVVGVRAEESAKRKNQPEWDMDEAESKPVFTYPVWRPLIAWTEEEVIRYHKEHNLEPNKHYIMGSRRVGCWPCIGARKHEIALIAEHDPVRIDLIREMETYVTQGAHARLEAKGESHQHPDGTRKIRTFFMNPQYQKDKRLAEKAGLDVKAVVASQVYVDQVVEWARNSGSEAEEETWHISCTKWGMCEAPDYGMKSTPTDASAASGGDNDMDLKQQFGSEEEREKYVAILVGVGWDEVKARKFNFAALKAMAAQIDDPVNPPDGTGEKPPETPKEEDDSGEDKGGTSPEKKDGRGNWREARKQYADLTGTSVEAVGEMMKTKGWKTEDLVAETVRLRSGAPPPPAPVAAPTETPIEMHVGGSSRIIILFVTDLGAAGSRARCPELSMEWNNAGPIAHLLQDVKAQVDAKLGKPILFKAKAVHKDPVPTTKDPEVEKKEEPAPKVKDPVPTTRDPAPSHNDPLVTRKRAYVINVDGVGKVQFWSENAASYERNGKTIVRVFQPDASKAAIARAISEHPDGGSAIDKVQGAAVVIAPGPTTEPTVTFTAVPVAASAPRKEPFSGPAPVMPTRGEVPVEKKNGHKQKTILYLDCQPSWPHTKLEEIVGPLQEAIELERSVAYHGVIPFNEGPKLVAAKLAERLAAGLVLPEHLSMVTFMPCTWPCFEVLVRQCEGVVTR